MRNSPVMTLLQIGKVMAVALLITFVGWVLASLLLSPRAPSFSNMPAVLAEAPCVAGVCVGDVGQQRALEQLAQHPLLSNVRNSSEQTLAFRIEEGGVGVLYFRQDEAGVYEVVDEINLRGGRRMLLGDALGALGPPQELFLMFGCGHGVHVHGKLFYPERGIELQVQFPSRIEKRDEAVALMESMSVMWIWYFESEKYEQWLLAIPHDMSFRNGFVSVDPNTPGEVLLGAVQPWPGLGVPVEPLDLCRQ